jgi:[FeFe] hydrogenase H-cluster maturation GTPase HydF
VQKTPKALRLQIALFGRTNVGKSSFLNMIAGQDVSITSSISGTTTDVVEKSMELLPIGPVVFLDTAGLDDKTELGEKRIKKTEQVYKRADIITLLCETTRWGDVEEEVVAKAKETKTPLIIVVNKSDISPPNTEFINKIKNSSKNILVCCSNTSDDREKYINEYKVLVQKNCPADFLTPPPLVGDLLQSGGTAILIVPIDLQAPKGRLILPQVQTIRDALDNDASVIVVKEREYLHMLENLREKPNIVICDSQVVLKMVADTPPDIPCTTFSILFSRLKGDIVEMVKGAAYIDHLKSGSKVLMAEACSHHSLEDDIGRVKIPRWLRQYVGADLEIECYAGRDYPEDLSTFDLIVHCGSCVYNRAETLARIQQAKNAGVPITNYGIAISHIQGVLKRVITPFPEALTAFNEIANSSSVDPFEELKRKINQKLNNI